MHTRSFKEKKRTHLAFRKPTVVKIYMKEIAVFLSFRQ